MSKKHQEIHLCILGHSRTYLPLRAQIMTAGIKFLYTLPNRNILCSTGYGVRF